MSDVLVSKTVSSEIPLEDQIYDGLIGAWDVVAKDYNDDGTFLETPGEWHFFRALEGRAVQDVWICPVRSKRFEGMSTSANRYGTSVRFFHPTEKVWHVVWINPVSGTVSQLIGTRVGADIVQTGTDDDGNTFRWVFTERTAGSCRWYGERSLDKEKSWTLEAEFLMTRKS